jgi:hypothetical protein
MTNPLNLAGFILLVAVGLLALGCALVGLMSTDHAGNLMRILGGMGGYFATWVAALYWASHS